MNIRKLEEDSTINKEKDMIPEACGVICSGARITYLLLKGGYEIGGKLGFIAGVCSSLAYNVICSDWNKTIYEMLIGSSAGVALGTLTGAFLISKKITIGLIGASSIVAAYKILCS